MVSTVLAVLGEEKRQRKYIKKVTTKKQNFIGVDLSNDLIVITNGNPYMKGLMDIHKCAYLPSGHNNSDIDSESSSIARVRNANCH